MLVTEDICSNHITVRDQILQLKVFKTVAIRYISAPRARALRDHLESYWKVKSRNSPSTFALLHAFSSSLPPTHALQTFKGSCLLDWPRTFPSFDAVLAAFELYGRHSRSTCILWSIVHACWPYHDFYCGIHEAHLLPDRYLHFGLQTRGVVVVVNIRDVESTVTE